MSLKIVRFQNHEEARARRLADAAAKLTAIPYVVVWDNVCEDLAVMSLKLATQIGYAPRLIIYETKDVPPLPKSYERALAEALDDDEPPLATHWEIVFFAIALIAILAASAIVFKTNP